MSSSSRMIVAAVGCLVFMAQACRTAQPDVRGVPDEAPEALVQERDVEQKAPTLAGESVRPVVLERLRTFFGGELRPEDYEAGVEPNLDLKGVHEAPSRFMTVFIATVPNAFGASYHLVLAQATDVEVTVEVHDLGGDWVVPGSQTVVSIEDVGPIAAVHGWILFPYALSTHSADFATDGECRQRSQSPTVTTSATIVCAPSHPCVTVPLAVEVAEPGFETDCEGVQTPMEPDVETFALQIAVQDRTTVRLARVSGTPPVELQGDFVATEDGLDLGEAADTTLFE